MRISIVTSVREDPRVEGALRSVFSQTDIEELQTVVINAGSDEKTRVALDKFEGRISCRVDEPDDGIYYGMNKGIDLCTGDIIGILNADDRYANSRVLQRVVERFEDPSVDVCYGDMVTVNARDAVVRYWKSKKSSRRKWQWGWMPPHPTYFVRRKLYENLGKFDTRLRLGADYELMMRHLYIRQVKAAYIEEVLVCMATGGASSNRLKAYRDMNAAWRMNGMCWGPVASTSRLFWMAYQCLLAKLPRYRRLIEQSREAE